MLAEIFGMDGIVVIVVLGVVLFGITQIPKLARSLGSARREFSQGLREGDNVPSLTVSELPIGSSEAPMATVSTPLSQPVGQAP
jgi:TatA/E family protein of Tat protein translocase